MLYEVRIVRIHIVPDRKSVDDRARAKVARLRRSINDAKDIIAFLEQNIKKKHTSAIQKTQIICEKTNFS